MKDLKVLRDRILELLRATEYLTPKTLPDGQGFGDYFVQFGGRVRLQVRDRMELTIRAIMESGRWFLSLCLLVMDHLFCSSVDVF